MAAALEEGAAHPTNQRPVSTPRSSAMQCLSEPVPPAAMGWRMEKLLKTRLTASTAPSFGTWVSSSSIVAVDALRDLPFEWVMIDTEHAQVNPETLAAMTAILASGRPAPLVRVGNVDQYLVKQALDSGAQGILAPLVNTEAQARALVSYAKYPPEGVRGAAAAAPSRYGRELASYLRTANAQTLVGAQIETVEALENVDAIAAVPGIDLLFVGPQDLTLSLGLVDERTHPRVREAMRHVVEVCVRHRKVPGTLVANLEEKKAAVEMGYRFISLASDVRFLLFGAQHYLDG